MLCGRFVWLLGACLNSQGGGDDSYQLHQLQSCTIHYHRLAYLTQIR